MGVIHSITGMDLVRPRPLLTAHRIIPLKEYFVHRENAGQSPFIHKLVKLSKSDNLQKEAMMLQEILFGTFVPPKESTSRIHKVGISGGRPYIPPKPKPSSLDKDGLNPTEKVVFKALQKKHKTLSSAELSGIVRMTRNHCSIILNSLFKKGMVNRYKVCQNSTRFFMYELKEQQ